MVFGIAIRRLLHDCEEKFREYVIECKSPAGLGVWLMYSVHYEVVTEYLLYSRVLYEDTPHHDSLSTEVDVDTDCAAPWDDERGNYWSYRTSLLPPQPTTPNRAHTCRRV